MTLTIVGVYAVSCTGYKLFGVHWSLRYTGLVMVLTLFGVLGLRIWANIYYLSRHRHQDGEGLRQIVVIGAGDGGSIYLDNHRRNDPDSEIVAVLDRDPAKQGNLIAGIRVLGDIDQLDSLSQIHAIDEVVVAIPSISPSDYIPILNRCNQLRLKVTKMPHVETLLTGSYLTGTKTRSIKQDAVH